MIYALHGFLGRPADWDFLDQHHEAVDIYSVGSPAENFRMTDWAKSFNRTIKNRNNILLGYGLGGRLALHSILDNPSLWSGAILVSNNFGISDSNERMKRLTQDFEWAKRFEVESWDSLMLSWNSQPIFSHTKSKNRYEHHYDRNRLANTLRFWSYGSQQDTMPLLAHLAVPLLYIAGEKDHKSVALAKDFSYKCPNAEIWIAPNAGHRVPWDSPRFFQENLAKFCNKYALEVN